MTGRRDPGDGLFYLLDNALAVSRQLEGENRAVPRMRMSCGHLETPLGAVPVIAQTPFPALVRPAADAERAAFARFGVEKPWPDEYGGLLEPLRAIAGAPIVFLSEAFVRIVLHPGRNDCAITVGTHGQPGWTNQNSFEPVVFEYLTSMSQTGGVLVDFAESFERRSGPPEPGPEKKREAHWADIRGKRVGERALALAKQPRDRLILLLAVRLCMTPAEIGQLNLSQVTAQFGRDGRRRTYLKKRIVRKKDIADALLQYRKRDRESSWDPKAPLFRGAKTAPSGRPARMGVKAIEECLLRHAGRAIKAMPAAPAAEEPLVLLPRPPLFWIADVAYCRT